MTSAPAPLERPGAWHREEPSMQTQLTCPLERSELHRQIDQQGIGDWHVRALLHALVDLGHITKLECQLPECPLDSREFVPRTGGRGQWGGKGIVVDHIHPQLQGGSDRVENLRILHMSCNCRRSRGQKRSDEVRAKISAAAKARPTRMRPGNGVTILTPEQVREMRAAAAKGAHTRALAETYGVCYVTARRAIERQGRYAEIE